MGPQAIVKEEVWEGVIPPVMMGSRLILSLLVDPVEGILGDLKSSPLSISSIRNEEENYLVNHWVMSPPRRWGMNPLIEMPNVPKKPTRGQLDDWLLRVFSEDR